MTRWRELLVIVGLFAVLILFAVYGPSGGASEYDAARGSVYGTGDEGALALQRWLSALGYQAANLEGAEWRIPDDAAVLLIITPRREPILDSEAQEVLRWVRDGGTLIAVDEQPQMLLVPNRLWQALGVTATVSDALTVEVAERATPAQPLLTNPPVESVPVQTTGALQVNDAGYVALLQTRFGPTLVGRQEGRGYMYLAVAAHPFTNAGLREPGSAALLLNLLRRVPQGATVLFDEYHHGHTTRAAAAAPTLRQIALSAWWGWAGLYALTVVAFYLVLTGRRFGRPIPLQRDVARRSSAEYVQSMAQLLRRGRKRQEIAQHYHDGLKRRMARPYGFVPPADDEEFVRRLINYAGATDEQAGALRQVLQELSRPDIGDTTLIQWVQAMDKLIDERGRFRTVGGTSAVQANDSVLRRRKRVA